MSLGQVLEARRTCGAVTAKWHLALQDPNDQVRHPTTITQFRQFVVVVGSHLQDEFGQRTAVLGKTLGTTMTTSFFKAAVLAAVLAKAVRMLSSGSDDACRMAD